MEGDTGSEGDGRPEDKPPDDEKLNERSVISGQRIAARQPFRKVLLDNHGELWLFRIWEGDHTRFTVEKGETVWKFGLEYSARSKFAREVRRLGGTV